MADVVARGLDEVRATSLWTRRGQEIEEGGSLLDDNNVVRVEIFDPPMCCPTGICGPTIDPVLLDIQEALLKIHKQFDRAASVERYLLSQQAARFMQNPQVLALLKKEGTGILPITVVEGEVVKTKSYPSFQELDQWIKARRDNHDQL